MIDVDKVRETVVCNLKEVLGVPVIRSNTAGVLPKLPFCSYTIQSLLENSGGTWQRMENGVDRIPARQVWSVTVNAEKYITCAKLAILAHDFFSKSGILVLKDNGIVVENVGKITPRDTLITVDYEYRQGFDVQLGFMNTREYDTEDVIQSAEIGGKVIQNGGNINGE